MTRLSPSTRNPRPNLALWLLAFLAIFISTVIPSDATAQNRNWVAAPHEFSEMAAWAYGDGSGGSLWQIDVVCAGGDPFVVITPWSTPADEQAGAVLFDFGTLRLERSGRFIRNVESGWTVLADEQLLDALRTGSSVRVTLPRGGSGQFGLRGSSASIGTALADCRPGSGANALQTAFFEFKGLVTNFDTGLPTMDPALFVEQQAKAFIATTCDGPAEFSEPGAVQAAFIDPDDYLDIVIDWTRITCTSRPFQRGGGFCGMQYCSADIFATRAFRPGSFPQSILHIGLGVGGDGSERLWTMRTNGTGVSWIWRNGRLVPAN